MKPSVTNTTKSRVLLLLPVDSGLLWASGGADHSLHYVFEAVHPVIWDEERVSDNGSASSSSHPPPTLPAQLPAARAAPVPPQLGAG